MNRNHSANDQSGSTDDHCKQLADLLPAYAFGICDADDKERAEKLLEQCPEYADDLTTYRTLAENMPYTIAQIDPPTSLRQSVLMRARKAQPHEKVIMSTRFMPELKRSRLLIAVAIVILIALNAAIIINTISMQYQQQAIFDQLSAQTAMIDLFAERKAIRFEMTPFSPESPENASGFVLCNPEERTALVGVHNLPSNSVEGYQVWLLASGETPERGGLIRVNPEGDGTVIFNASRPMGEYQYIGVSVKEVGDTSESYPPPLIAAPLYNVSEN